MCDNCKKPQTHAESLAEAHWSYNKGLLEAFGLPLNEVKSAGYVYKTAFLHGYKHAMELPRGAKDGLSKTN